MSEQKSVIEVLRKAGRELPNEIYVEYMDAVEAVAKLAKEAREVGEIECGAHVARLNITLAAFGSVE